LTSDDDGNIILLNEDAKPIATGTMKSKGSKRIRTTYPLPTKRNWMHNPIL
jgi:hypothetical protein